MSRSTKVLVVDDEPQIRRFLRSTLSAQNFEVLEAETGAAALAAASREKPDLVVLDLGLPDQDGIEVLRQIREHSALPVIVLSVRSDERQKVEALDLGADDYVVKPFGIDEFMARMRTALRHRLQEEGATPVVSVGDITIDLVRRKVARAGADVRLSRKEYDLLALLATHLGKVLTHRHLLREVWGPAHADDLQYLRVFVRQLRQKLEADPAQPRHILTEPGVGYRLETGT
jgi:two-component system KDP operon response regulator KdpE